MRGSIVKRGSRYNVVLELARDPVSGKRRSKWFSGYKTKREAEQALSRLLTSRDDGSYIEPTKQTMSVFVEEWLAAIAPTLRPSTHFSYSRNLRLHVLPALGSVELRRLDGGMLNSLYAQLLANGKRSTAYGGGGLSARSTRYVHTIIHRALRDAVRWGTHHPQPRGRCRPAQGLRNIAIRDVDLDR
jgi:hypothetical protein